MFQRFLLRISYLATMVAIAKESAACAPKKGAPAPAAAAKNAAGPPPAKTPPAKKVTVEAPKAAPKTPPSKKARVEEPKAAVLESTVLDAMDDMGGMAGMDAFLQTHAAPSDGA